MVSTDRRTGRRAAQVAGLVAGCTIVLGACSSGNGDDAPAAAASATASTPAAGTGTSTGTGTGTAAGTASTASPAPAPTTAAPGPGGATRTAAPDRPVPVPPTPFEAPARYGDGVQVSVRAVAQGKVTATGPGELTGQPFTSFRITFTNRSDRALDLTRVVVSVTYGSQRLDAAPVYGNAEVSDFSGTIGAGKTAAAVYAFSIPTTQLRAVTMRVDFAADHQPATFVGRVPPPS